MKKHNYTYQDKDVIKTCPHLVVKTKAQAESILNYVARNIGIDLVLRAIQGAIMNRRKSFKSKKNSDKITKLFNRALEYVSKHEAEFSNS